MPNRGMGKRSGSTDPPPFAGAAFDIIAIATSAGGLDALSRLLSRFSREFPAAIVVVQHLAPQFPSHIASILSRHTSLKVRQAADRDSLAPGNVYICPPDRHLLVTEDGHLALSSTDKIHFLRPSADLLFESVAQSFGERALAIVLTGTGKDGASGIEAIKRCGGKVIVQTEASSQFAGMPQAAIQTGCADMVLPLDEIASAVETLVLSHMREEQRHE